MRSVGILTQRVAPLLTAAGQRRISTGLSPLRLMAVPHQNRLAHNISTIEAQQHSLIFAQQGWLQQRLTQDLRRYAICSGVGAETATSEKTN